MYYVFSNWEELYRLCKERKFKELAEAIKKSEMVMLENFEGVHPSAKEAYRYICKVMNENNANEEKALVNTYAVDAFVDKMDVDALMMIHSDSRLGSLSQAALQIVNEFNGYKTVALETFKENSHLGSFMKEVGSIKVKYSVGRLVFIKDGKEYVVFYGEEI